MELSASRCKTDRSRSLSRVCGTYISTPFLDAWETDLRCAVSSALRVSRTHRASPISGSIACSTVARSRPVWSRSTGPVLPVRTAGWAWCRTSLARRSSQGCREMWRSVTRGTRPPARRSPRLPAVVARQARIWLRDRLGDVRARSDWRYDGARAGAGRVPANSGLAPGDRSPACFAAEAASTLHLRAGVLLAPRQHDFRTVRGSRSPRAGPRARSRAPGSRHRLRLLSSRLLQCDGARLCRAVRAEAGARADPQSLCRPHIHQSHAGRAQREGQNQVQSGTRGAAGKEGGRRRRLPRSRHDEPRAGADDSAGRRERGPLPGGLGADHRSLLLRDRYAYQVRADRLEPFARGDPPAFGGGDAGVSVAGRYEARRRWRYDGILPCLFLGRLPHRNPR